MIENKNETSRNLEKASIKRLSMYRICQNNVNFLINTHRQPIGRNEVTSDETLQIAIHKPTF